MKKLSKWIVLSMMAAVLLTGCGKKEDTANTESGTGKTEASGTAQEIWLKDISVENYLTLGDYKNATAAIAPITEDEIESNTQALYLSIYPADKGVTDKAVELGDTANIDYEGKKDGVAFQGGTAAGYNLTIGSGQFIPGFEDGLVGVMAGETVDLPLKFPDNYGSADLAGQEVIFTVTVNYIIPKEMDDDIIREAMAAYDNGITDAASLRAYAAEYLDSYYRQQVSSTALDQLVAETTFAELPADLVEQFKANTVLSLNQVAASMGTTAENYVSMYYGQDFDSFVADYSMQALQMNMVCQAIAKEEGLLIDDAKLEEMLANEAAEYGISVEEMLGEVSKEEYRQFYVYEAVSEYLADIVAGK